MLYTCDTHVIVVVVVAVVRLGGGVRRRGLVITAAVDMTSYLSGNDTYFITTVCYLFHFIFFVKMTTKKAHETTTPDVCGSTSGFHVRRLYSFIQSMMTKKWAKKCSVGNVFAVFRPKKRNPILKKKSS